MAAPRIDYEWWLEFEDAHGDIIELEFSDTLAGFGLSADRILDPNESPHLGDAVKVNLCLKRQEWTEWESGDKVFAVPNSDGKLVYGDWYPSPDTDNVNLVWRDYPNMKMTKRFQTEYDNFFGKGKCDV